MTDWPTSISKHPADPPIIRACVRLNPYSACYGAKGDWERSAADAKACIEKDPGFLKGAWVCRSWGACTHACVHARMFVCCVLSTSDESMHAYSICTTTRMHMAPPGYYRLTLAQVELKDYDGAMETLQAGLKRDPGVWSCVL